MLERFTDAARAVVRDSFGNETTAMERDLLAAMNARPNSLAARALASAGVDVGRIPADGVALDRSRLVSEAIAEAQRRGSPYVGTEHLMLAVASDPESSLHRLGVAAGLGDSLSAAEAEWKRAHPPLARRLGTAWRAVWGRLRGPSA